MELERESCGELFAGGEDGNYARSAGRPVSRTRAGAGGRSAAGMSEVRAEKELLQNNDSQVNRIISRETAKNLLDEGWQAADLHVHTFYSYDVVPTEEVDPIVLYEKANRRGMSFICFTDHDTMDAYDKVGWTRERVITGVEVKILDPKRVGHTVHINVYTLNRAQFLEIERIARRAQDIEMLVEYLKAENLPFSLNHPFWHEPGEKLNAAAVVELAGMFPVLEYNLGRIRKLNRMVLEVAAARNRGVVAGTDSHTGDIGRIFTVARGNNFMEFYESIKNGSAYLVTEDLTYHRLKNEIRNRLEMLMDGREWIMDKDGLKMETGNALADAVIGTLSGGREEALTFKRELVKFLARLVSQTGLPARIYLRKQNLLASRIQQELNLAV